jgi:hypothetical protein
MQINLKTPITKFAFRVLVIALCLTIGLSTVVVPARAELDPVHDKFVEIASGLAAQGIASNIGDVYFSNVVAFPNLYFEKWTTVGDPSTRLGKITFKTPTNFSESATQEFLLDLGNKMEMGIGHISLDVRTSTAFQAHPASLTMYGLPLGTTVDQLLVRDDDGNILDLSDIVSDFTQDPVTGDVTFNVFHFTQFDIFKYRICLPLITR